MTLDKPSLFLQKFFDPRDVFGNIYAHGVVFDFRDANLPAIFEPAELFELLDTFEFALRQCRILEKCVALKDIQSEMLEVPHLDFARSIADPRNRSTREIDPVVVEI